MANIFSNTFGRVTELVTGLGTLGFDDLDGALAARRPGTSSRCSLDYRGSSAFARSCGRTICTTRRRSTR